MASDGLEPPTEYAARPADDAFPPETIVEFKEGSDPWWPSCVINANFDGDEMDVKSTACPLRTPKPDDVVIVYFGPGDVKAGGTPYYATANYKNKKKIRKVTDGRISFYRDCIADPKKHLTPKNFGAKSLSKDYRNQLKMAMEDVLALNLIDGRKAKHDWWLNKLPVTQHIDNAVAPPPPDAPQQTTVELTLPESPKAAENRKNALKELAKAKRKRANAEGDGAASDKFRDQQHKVSTVSSSGRAIQKPQNYKDAMEDSDVDWEQNEDAPAAPSDDDFNDDSRRKAKKPKVKKAPPEAHPHAGKKKPKGAGPSRPKQVRPPEAEREREETVCDRMAREIKSIDGTTEWKEKAKHIRTVVQSFVEGLMEHNNLVIQRRREVKEAQRKHSAALEERDRYHRDFKTVIDRVAESRTTYQKRLPMEDIGPLFKAFRRFSDQKKQDVLIPTKSDGSHYFAGMNAILQTMRETNKYWKEAHMKKEGYGGAGAGAGAGGGAAALKQQERNGSAPHGDRSDNRKQCVDILAVSLLNRNPNARDNLAKAEAMEEEAYQEHGEGKGYEEAMKKLFATYVQNK